jgi:hypothetical protein
MAMLVTKEDTAISKLKSSSYQILPLLKGLLSLLHIGS